MRFFHDFLELILLKHHPIPVKNIYYKKLKDILEKFDYKYYLNKSGYEYEFLISSNNYYHNSNCIHIYCPLCKRGAIYSLELSIKKLLKIYNNFHKQYKCDFNKLKTKFNITYFNETFCILNIQCKTCRNTWDETCIQTKEDFIENHLKCCKNEFY